jgi:hypothetical protein
MGAEYIGAGATGTAMAAGPWIGVPSGATGTT